MKTMRTMKTMMTLGLLIAYSASGGDRVGNSGKTVICYTADPKLGGKVASVELLDFFEAREVKGLTIDLPEAGDVDKMVTETFEKMSDLDPTRMKSYLSAFQLLKKNSRFTNRAAISEIDDGWSPVEGKDHCYIRQLAVQSKPPTQFDPWLLVDNGIWEKMIARERAGLWIHESILHEEVKAGSAISDGTRSFTGILASNRFQELDRNSYFEVINSLLYDKSLPTVVDGIWLKTPDFSTHSNGRLKSGTLLSETEFPLKPWLGVVCKENNQVVFRADGELDSCTITGFQVPDQNRLYIINRNNNTLFSRHPDGTPKWERYDLQGVFQVQSGSVLIPVESNSDARDLVIALCPLLDQKIPYRKIKINWWDIIITEEGNIEISTFLTGRPGVHFTKFILGSTLSLPSCEGIAKALN